METIAKRTLNDLTQQRMSAIRDAETALEAKNHDSWNAAMERVRNLNTEIENCKTLIAEQDKKMLTKAPTAAEMKDIAGERMNDLRCGRGITFTTNEIRRAFLNSVTVATGNLVAPAGNGTVIRDSMAAVRPSTLLDQVSVVDLTGLSSYTEPYVITELPAVPGKVKTNAGNARTASTDPTFGVAEIAPYELTTTSYVDRNLSRMNEVPYYEKIQEMAMKALRRGAAKLIAIGDAETTHVFGGIYNAKNKAGTAICATEKITGGVTETLLDKLFFAYGSTTDIGMGGRLYLTKTDLRAIAQLRNSDKERVFKVTPDAVNPNIGTIDDSGNVLPYCIVPDLTSLSTTTAGSSAVNTMIYGDPANFELGLFGGYTIRTDDSYKAAERLTTILGDVLIGGNVIVDKGFVIATV